MFTRNTMLGHGVNMASRHLVDIKPLWDLSEEPADGHARIFIGDNTVGFDLPIEQVKLSSAYFLGAFRTHWIEGEDRKIRLGNVEHGGGYAYSVNYDRTDEAFKWYCAWLQSPTYVAERLEPHTSCFWAIEGDVVWSLANAYLLGDRIMASDFQDTVIDVLSNELSRKPNLSAENILNMARIFKAILPAGAPGVACLVDLCLRLSADGRLWELGSNISDEVADIYSSTTEACGVVKRIRQAATGRSCAYHLHGADKSCYSDATTS